MFVSWYADVRPHWRVEVRQDAPTAAEQDPGLPVRVETALRDCDLAKSPRVRLAAGALVVELSVKAEDEPGAVEAAAVLVAATLRSTDRSRARGWCGDRVAPRRRVPLGEGGPQGEVGRGELG